MSHLHQDWTLPCSTCAWTGLTRTASAPGLDPPLPASAPELGAPQPHRATVIKWAHPIRSAAARRRADVPRESRVEPDGRLPGGGCTATVQQRDGATSTVLQRRVLHRRMLVASLQVAYSMFMVA